MKWEDHDLWAAKFGISTEVSREVNTIIDAVKQGDKISGEYNKYLQLCASKVGNNSSNSAFGLVAADYAKRALLKSSSSDRFLSETTGH